MNNKNLPIKFFEKRKKDEMDTEGAPRNTNFDWATKEQAQIVSVFLRERLNVIRQQLQKKVKNNNYIPSVAKLKVNEQAASTKTVRGYINTLFNTNQHVNLISLINEDEFLVKITIDDINFIYRNINKIDIAFPSSDIIIGLSSITDFNDFSPIIQDFESEESAVKIKLINYGDTELNKVLINQFESYCKEKEISVTKQTYSRNQIIYSTDSLTYDTLEDLREFEGVLSISEMPSFETMGHAEQEEQFVATQYPQEDVDYVVVGVLDTGIEDIEHLAPWKLDESEIYYAEEDINKAHGTFVSGIINYGDNLEGRELTKSQGCKLLEAVVFPGGRIDEDELIYQIRDAISRHPEIKIWNLSLGTKTEVDSFEFSDFAIALDEIQEEFNILICKSAGNCDNFKRNIPVSRISKSADTVRGLVVGSLAHNKSDTDLSETNTASPFSRIGPGPAGIIKPDVVHFGGNSGIDINGNAIFNGVKSFSSHGLISKQVGTSFSTPRITSLAAGILSKINEEFDPLLIKALIIHSAKHPTELQGDISSRINSVGFGLPTPVDDVLYNDSSEITLILQDSLEKGSFYEVQEFPFPTSLVNEDGFFDADIKVTLVTNPILDGTQGKEYCQSNIDVALGTYDFLIDRKQDKPTKFVKNKIGAEGKQNVLVGNNYSRKQLSPNSPKRNERFIISYEGSYQPVKKWKVDLAEFTEANRIKYLSKDKKWYLKITGLFRDNVEAISKRRNETPSQTFCLIITIKSKNPDKDIYTEVTRLLDTYNFTHYNLNLRENIQVGLSNG